MPGAALDAVLQRLLQHDEERSGQLGQLVEAVDAVAARQASLHASVDGIKHQLEQASTRASVLASSAVCMLLRSAAETLQPDVKRSFCVCAPVGPRGLTSEIFSHGMRSRRCEMNSYCVTGAGIAVTLSPEAVCERGVCELITPGTRPAVRLLLH